MNLMKPGFIRGQGQDCNGKSAPNRKTSCTKNTNLTFWRKRGMWWADQGSSCSHGGQSTPGRAGSFRGRQAHRWGVRRGRKTEDSFLVPLGGRGSSEKGKEKMCQWSMCWGPWNTCRTLRQRKAANQGSWEPQVWVSQRPAFQSQNLCSSGAFTL